MRRTTSSPPTSIGTELAARLRQSEAESASIMLALMLGLARMARP
jgi:hypothetical protein